MNTNVEKTHTATTFDAIEINKGHKIVVEKWLLVLGGHPVNGW